LSPLSRLKKFAKPLTVYYKNAESFWLEGKTFLVRENFKCLKFIGYINSEKIIVMNIESFYRAKFLKRNYGFVQCYHLETW